MKFIFSTSLLFLLLGSQLSGQGILLDSLNVEELPLHEPAVKWVPAYNQLADNYLYKDPDSALFISEKILNAIDTSQYAPYLYELYLNMGIAYYVKSDFLKSYRTHLKSLNVAQHLKDTTYIARAYNALGAALSGQKKWDHALEYHQKSVHFAEKVNNTRSLSRNFVNMGIIYFYKGNYDKAYQYFIRSDSASQKIVDHEFQALAKAWQGQSLYELGQLESAYQKYESALAFPELNKWDEGFIYGGLAELYLAQGKVDEAINAAEKSIEIGKEVTSLWDIQRAFDVMAQAYANKSQYQKAYEYMHKSKQLSDSLSSMEKEKEINFLLLKEEELQNQLLRETASHQESQLEQSRLILGASILTLLFLLTAVFLLYKWNKEKQNLNEQLKKQNSSIAGQQKEIMTKNKELSALNEEKDFLIGLVAHDLRSPLSNIKGLIGLIKDSELSEENKLYLEKIEESEEKMDSMIHRILNIKTIESKVLDMDLKPLDMSEVLFETAKRFSNQVFEKNLQLIKVNQAEEPLVVADLEYLEQVFENLISNAIKFSPSGRKVELRIEENDNQVLAKIIDEGPGISMEDQKHLFLMYNKLSAQPTAGESSTGLGLAIVKKFVDGMGAKVWCESDLGKGCTFVVAFDKAVK